MDKRSESFYSAALNESNYWKSFCTSLPAFFFQVKGAESVLPESTLLVLFWNHVTHYHCSLSVQQNLQKFTASDHLKPTVNFFFICVSHLETVNKIGLFFSFLHGRSWDVWGWFWFHYDRISLRKWNGSVERI